MDDAHDGRSYVLEPLDTSGIFLGLSALQCALVGGGISLAVALITVGLPVVAAAVPVLVGSSVSFVRVGGLPAWEWMPVGAAWLWAGITRGRRWVAPLPLWPVDQAKTPPLPPCLDGLEIVEIPWGSANPVGAVHDTHRHTLTAIVRVRGGEFVLRPAAEQDRLVAGWGDILGQLSADAGVEHISWSELVRPAGLADHSTWLAERGEGPDPTYGELIDLAAGTTIHDATVSISVARDKLHHRRASRHPDHDSLADALVVAAQSLIRGCDAAGLHPDVPLGPAGLRRLLRDRIDPRTPGRAGRLGERLGLTAAAAGPLAMDTQWDHIRCDAGWHRTYWVASWPRLQVPASWLEPFLSLGEIPRTTTVVMVPVPAHQSRRRIQRDLVKLESDATTLEEKGRRVDARHHRATRALLDREQELVAGYVEMAYAGLVTVSASNADELDTHTAIVEQHAREAGIDLRSLDGRQDLAWAAALPLGLAPKAVLGT